MAVDSLPARGRILQPKWQWPPPALFAGLKNG